ncbi:hypothetical protein GCM10027262_40620 [Nocardia tengchongensis]
MKTSLRPRRTDYCQATLGRGTASSQLLPAPWSGRIRKEIPLITTLTVLGGMIILAAMAMSGFIANDAPRALVRVRNR